MQYCGYEILPIRNIADEKTGGEKSVFQNTRQALQHIYSVVAPLCDGSPARLSMLMDTMVPHGANRARSSASPAETGTCGGARC